MKRPLVPVALCYAAGVLVAERVDLPLAATLAWGLVLAGVGLLWDRVSPWVLGPALALAGAANLTLQTRPLAPHDLRALFAGPAELVRLRGRLCETPALRIDERDAEPHERTLAFVEARFLQAGPDRWQPAMGRVAVSTGGRLPAEFFGGRWVEVSGLLSRPPGPLAEGLFDYQTHLRRLGVHFQLKATSAADWALAPHQPPRRPPWPDRFGAWAKATLARGLPEEDEPLRLLWAMTLGWRTALSGEVAEPFMRSGTMHVFAISGLHIALIAGILVAVLRVLRVPRAACGLGVAPLLWLYTAATGWQASAVRSTVMMTVVLGGWALRRPSDLLNSLAAAAWLILLWDPQQMFQAGFQLSFFVVLSLALMGPVLRGLQRRLLAPDPLLPEELRPRWQRWARPAAHGLAAGFTTSLAAWLGSLPWIAFYFHLLTPASLLANLLVVPLSSAALACNLASLAVGGWFPACAELFNHSAWFWMTLMIRLSAGAARLPGGWCYVAAPTLPGFAAYYFGLASVMAGWWRQARLRPWCAVALLTLGGVWLARSLHARAATRLTVLPLNGGQAVYLTGRHSQGNWLIDCGDESAVRFTTKPFLAARGVNRLDRLVLTHGDVRHVGGAALVAGEFAAGELIVSPVPFRSLVYRELVGPGRGAPGRLRVVRRGERLGPWLVLHPGDGRPFPLADDNATVLRGVFGGTRLLLLSDLGPAGQRALLESGADLRADIVVSGLPSRGEALGEELLAAVRPRLVVVVDAPWPPSARAPPRLRDRLARSRCPVLFTSEAGGVTVELRPGRWRLTSAGGLVVSSRERAGEEGA